LKKQTKNKATVSGSDYFDDCAVCMYMKSVEEGKPPPTLEEMKKIFKQAKKGGAIVGAVFLRTI
jgi:hypothetical protein